MKNHEQSVEMNYNLNWPYIPDHPYRFLIIAGTRYRKTNVLLNLIKHQRPDIDKICLYVKDPFESKYELLINVRTNNFKNPRVSIAYSQTVEYVCETLEDYNQTKESRELIVFDTMIAGASLKKNKSYCY